MKIKRKIHELKMVFKRVKSKKQSYLNTFKVTCLNHIFIRPKVSKQNKYVNFTYSVLFSVYFEPKMKWGHVLVMSNLHVKYEDFLINVFFKITNGNPF